MSGLLFYGGVVVAGASVIVGLVFIVILWISKHRLNAKLDAEYGKRK